MQIFSSDFWNDRLKASGIHLGISLLIAFLAALLVFGAAPARDGAAAPSNRVRIRGRQREWKGDWDRSGNIFIRIGIADRAGS